MWDIQKSGSSAEILCSQETAALFCVLVNEFLIFYQSELSTNEDQCPSYTLQNDTFLWSLSERKKLRELRQGEKQ